jgi:hypothetical protein
MNLTEIECCRSVVIPANIVTGGNVKPTWTFSINNLTFIPDYAILTSVHSVTAVKTDYQFAITCNDFYPNPFCIVACDDVSYNVQTVIPLKKGIQQLTFQIGEIQTDNSVSSIDPTHISTPWFVSLTFDLVKLKSKK